MPALSHIRTCAMGARIRPDLADADGVWRTETSTNCEYQSSGLEKQQIGVDSSRVVGPEQVRWPDGNESACHVAFGTADVAMIALAT